MAKLVKIAVFRPAGAIVYTDQDEIMSWSKTPWVYWHCLPNLALFGECGEYRSPKYKIWSQIAVFRHFCPKDGNSAHTDQGVI